MRIKINSTIIGIPANLPTVSVGKFAGIPIIVEFVNRANQNKLFRKVLDKSFGVAADAPVPSYHNKTFRKTAQNQINKALVAEPSEETFGKVVLFSTCYCNYNRPDISEDLLAVFQHNNIPVIVPKNQTCCGMPKLELGDFDSINQYKKKNIPMLLDYVEQGYDIVAPVPSCVLMFKQELPLMYPDDESVLNVRNAFYDPFEYLILRYKAGKLNTEFKNTLGKINYHVACHLEVQNMGFKTEQLLQLIPGVELSSIQRCSGHDGTYGVRSETRKTSLKIGKPVFSRFDDTPADYHSSDCPMAGSQIQSGTKKQNPSVHPLTLLRKAYGI